MTALQPSQQNNRLTPQTTTTPTTSTSPTTGTTNTGIPGLSQLQAGITGLQSTLGGIGSFFSAIPTFFSNLFNTFGIAGGWLAFPTRILKMVVGVVLVGIGLHMFSTADDKDGSSKKEGKKGKKSSSGGGGGRPSLASDFTHSAASGAGSYAGSALAKKVGTLVSKRGKATSATSGSASKTTATTTAEEDAALAAA